MAVTKLGKMNPTLSSLVFAMPKAYDRYGFCPLTVEHGKIILAEFGYGGKLMPSFPWDSTKPTRAAWFLKNRCCRGFIGVLC